MRKPKTTEEFSDLYLKLPEVKKNTKKVQNGR